MRRDALALVATCATLFVGARAQPGGGPGGGGGASACANPTQTSNPQAASLRGDVGCTTSASPALTYSHETSETVGGTIATNAHIYGPFDAGFSSSQDGLISNWGCSPTSLAYDATGGLDLGYEHAKLAVVCGVTLPRISGTEWKDLLGQCGGHTGRLSLSLGVRVLRDEGRDALAKGGRRRKLERVREVRKLHRADVSVPRRVRWTLRGDA